MGVDARAVKTHGRLVVGATMVAERYKTNDFGSTSNDMMLAATRYFYKISEVGEDQWEYVLDFRDKHDFFGKLNKDQLQLDSKNEFQIRQLSTRWVINPAGVMSAQLGRFQSPEAGSVFVDGGSMEYRYNTEWKTGLLAGLNPKNVEQAYLQYNAKASQGGVFLNYQGKSHDWTENKYANLALVTQTYVSQTERTFLYNNLVYQWENESRIMNTIYYDFVPSAKIQTLNFLYQQKISNRLNSDLNLLHVDVIEYKRNQNLLDKLTASPYDELRLQFEYKVSRFDNVAMELTSGKRQTDRLTKNEIVLGYDFNNSTNRNDDIKTQIGYRKNFTSNDLFLKVGYGYYSKNWEINFDNQLEQNKNNDGTNTHPLTTDFGITSFYSKQLYYNFSFQRAADENVSIYGVFFRLGYRFGNQEIPAVRDGAPPRGAI